MIIAPDLSLSPHHVHNLYLEPFAQYVGINLPLEG
jgi:hypothetical protein